METYIDRLTLVEDEKIRVSTNMYEELAEMLENSSNQDMFAVLDADHALECTVTDESTTKVTNDLGVILTNPFRIRVFTSRGMSTFDKDESHVSATLFIAKEGTVIQTSSSFDQDGNEYKNYRDLNIHEQSNLFVDIQRYFNIT